jgi:hypothetical protein
MQKITYDIKYTSANTEYLTLDENDMATVQIAVISLLTYLTELSIAKDKRIRDFTTVWFTKSDKRYHYNSKLKKYNTPQSYLAGVVNNLQFGNQKDLSLLQLQTLQDIINTGVDVVDTVEAFMGNTLQKNKMFTKIWIQENVWSVGQAV